MDCSIQLLIIKWLLAMVYLMVKADFNKTGINHIQSIVEQNVKNQRNGIKLLFHCLDFRCLRMGKKVSPSFSHITHLPCPPNYRVRIRSIGWNGFKCIHSSSIPSHSISNTKQQNLVSFYFLTLHYNNRKSLFLSRFQCIYNAFSEEPIWDNQFRP